MEIPVLLNVGLDVKRIDHEIVPIWDLTFHKVVDYHCELKLQVGHTGTIYLNLSELGQLDEMIEQLNDIRKIWFEKVDSLGEK